MRKLVSSEDNPFLFFYLLIIYKMNKLSITLCRYVAIKRNDVQQEARRQSSRHYRRSQHHRQDHRLSFRWSWCSCGGGGDRYIHSDVSDEEQIKANRRQPEIMFSNAGVICSDRVSMGTILIWTCRVCNIGYHMAWWNGMSCKQWWSGPL